jgi:hypothetical protein
VKAVAADRGEENEADDIPVGIYMQQQLVGLADHQDCTYRNKKIAIDEEPERGHSFGFPVS